ncbi:conjugal transfer protein [Streptomyces flavotricini]|uniref:Conjugal transfer protein n=1 Tax=Streptomyces flavotricini TaxID=66888 RepID=A0ABS8EI41_9ACTN|nr:conjugal transfer protein [Streptomyces flavotricini]MCC0100697.1 conjugal transfer protein [Streptomyces flavotricini]
MATVLVVPHGTAAQAVPAAQPAGAPRLVADAAGTAAVFVDLWLRADAASPDSPVATTVRAMAPAADLPRRARTESAAPGSDSLRVVPVRTTSTPGGWTVVVAVLTDTAHTPSPSTGQASERTSDTFAVARYFAVSGTGGQNGSPVTVTGSPAEVAPPDTAPAPASPYTRPVPAGDTLGTTVGEFLRAYLAGGQATALERYLSPGVRLSTPTAAAYARVDVEEVAADTDRAAANAVPGDGVRARVRVRVSGEDRAGSRWPLVYRLEMTTRAGRWEVSALDAGTASSAPTPAASAQAGAQ